MKQGTVTTTGTLFLSAIDDDDKIQKFWGCLFHNKEYLTIKNLTVMDVFKTKTVLTESLFRRKYGSEFLTRDTEAQLPPVIILLQSARFALMCWSQKGSDFSDSQCFMQFRLAE